MEITTKSCFFFLFFFFLSFYIPDCIYWWRHLCSCSLYPDPSYNGIEVYYLRGVIGLPIVISFRDRWYIFFGNGLIDDVIIIGWTDSGFRISRALIPLHTQSLRGWLDVAKMSCILRHWGVQLILAYSWARPAILVAGKSRGGMFLFLLFLHFHSCSSFFPVPLFHLHYYLFYLFSPFLWETTQNDPQGLICQ